VETHKEFTFRPKVQFDARQLLHDSRGSLEDISSKRFDKNCRAEPIALHCFDSIHREMDRYEIRPSAKRAGENKYGKTVLRLWKARACISQDEAYQEIGRRFGNS